MTKKTIKPNKDFENFKKLFLHPEPRVLVAQQKYEFRVGDLDSSVEIAKRIIESNSLNLKIGGKNPQLRSFDVEIL